jgi:nicotinate phosphoribosyltransferase
MNLSAHNFSGLTTDFYEVTMACSYWKAGASKHEAAFHVVFRKNPLAGGFTVVCGLAPVIDLLRGFRFSESEISYLALQRGNDGQRLFEDAFLEALRAFRFAGDVDALPEGTLAFPHEPLIRICGSNHSVSAR